MDILFWLVPPAAVTLVAMLWVSWLGRAGRGDVDREEAVRRMGVVLSRERTGAPGYAVKPPERDRSTGVAVRPSRRAS